jgi:phosphopantothenoylcysteine decarboxylase / phosphopantothenate---cysteine ligase
MNNPFHGKEILLGVTGSIAAYKAVELASRLTKQGAIVSTILTESATKFVSPLSFQSVTGQKAYTEADLWGTEGHVTHIGLGHKADFYAIVPASANTIAKLAHGFGDNLLTVTALASHCPILLAPAMDAGMYDNAATQDNVTVLKSRGFHFIGPVPGHLASGLEGVGRMAEPQDVASRIRYLISRHGPLQGKNILITAGGTQEPIDPVRRITNRSSGKQGVAIAQAALDAGADVTLVIAPHHLILPDGAQVINVVTAAEMGDAVLQQIAFHDVLVMSAAVADFRPIQNETKIKKSNGIPSLILEETEDILKAVHQRKAAQNLSLIIIGFAAESENLLAYASEKVQAKGLDMIVANDILKPGAGFDGDTNQVTLIMADGRFEKYPIMPKIEVADLILQKILLWSSKND